MRYVYIRTSKTSQDLSLQRDALNKHGVDVIFEEQVSGVKQKPELEKLLSELKPNDSVTVWKLDRLSRTTKELVNLIDDFNTKGIQFISLTENIDTTTPTGKFLVTVLCAMAAMERDVLIMRTRAGLEAARARGRSGGRPPTSKEKVKTALALYRSGEYSVNEICQKVGISRSTLYRLLKASKSDKREGTYNE